MNVRWGWYVAAAAAGVAADLWSKSIIFERCGPPSAGKSLVVIDGFFNIVCEYNDRFAFGLGPDNRTFVVLLHLAAFAAIGYLLFHLRRGNAFVRLALTLIVAGAIGNLYDRLALGKVRDFIDWHAGSGALGRFCESTFGRSHWPTFNVADSMVSVGAAIIVLSLLLAPRSKHSRPRRGT